MMFRRGFFVAMVSAMFGWALAQPGHAKLDNDEVDVTLIVHCCPGNVFFEPLMYGAQEAARLFDVNLDIQNAEGDPQRQAFVGQDFIASGYIIGSRMVGDYGLGEGDHCVAPVEFPDLTYAGRRYAGVKMALDEAGVTSEMIGTGDQVAENLNIVAEYLLANPETDCAIGLGNVSTSVLPLAAEEAGLEGLPNGGFDVDPRIVENIGAGKTTATMDQQFFWQGFLPVMFIAYNVRYNLAPADVNTGNGVVDAMNLKMAMDHAGTYR